MGEQEVSLPPEEAGENSETAGPVVDKDTDGEELALPLTPFESQTLEDPVEVLNPERSSEIQELDNEFIGELVDEVITKKIAEYDEGKKEEEIKKKKN
ncbi:MAG: hypothetical protein ACE5FU_13120 [Nitrospinota bacterium]